MVHTNDEATAHAWSALGGRPELLEGVSYQGASGVLPARLPVRELARATVGVCSLAAAELLARRGAGAVPPVRVREAAVATAFVSERHLRVDGRTPTSFAPLSGFWRAADGWVRTHANYPHHRARLLDALGIPGSADEGVQVARLTDELAARPAQSVQEAVYAAGGLAVAVASAPLPPGSFVRIRPDEGAGSGAVCRKAEEGGTAEPWQPTTTRRGAAPDPANPACSGREALALPLVEAGRTAGGGPRRLPAASLPAAGVRVLDLTRVIAGPVATRTLALLGADVLRVDAPRLPEDRDAHADTGFGKRSTRLDLFLRADRKVFEDLLGSADVVITGYRPGALDRYGLAPDDLLERRPGLIVAQLCAWGWSGPWAARRGFDSLVQAASGIAAVEASAEGRPGVLPAQALDHGTGYLLAAAVLRALTERQTAGVGSRLRLSLAGTASWLLHGVRPHPLDGEAYEPGPWLTRTASPYGPLDHALPPVHFDGAPRTWDRSPTLWGEDRPVWS